MAVDDQKHPSCDCEGEQRVIAACNDMIALLSIVTRDNGLCALNALVCTHLLVVYMRDVISRDPDAERLNTEAKRKAEDIYSYSQSYIEKNHGVRTTLSDQKGKLC